MQGEIPRRLANDSTHLRILREDVCGQVSYTSETCDRAQSGEQDGSDSAVMLMMGHDDRDLRSAGCGSRGGIGDTHQATIHEGAQCHDAGRRTREGRRPLVHVRRVNGEESQIPFFVVE